MAIINLGSNTIDIGASPVLYTPFNFRDDRAYIISGRATIEEPNNIFSRFRILPTFTNGTFTNFRTHHDIVLPLSEIPFVFLLPFSNLYGGNGSVTIQVERESLVRGTSDRAGDVTLELEYDDSVSQGTWL